MRYFNIRISNESPAGDKHEPVIYFYDALYSGPKFGPLGQFTGGSYYLRTLVEDRINLERTGLNLDGGIPEWTVSPAQMVMVFQFIKAWKKLNKNA